MKPKTHSYEAQPSPETITKEAAALKAIYKNRKAINPSLTQYQLADECGWSSQGTVSQYLNGRLELNLEALLRFAKVLQFDPAEVSPRLSNMLNITHKIEEPASDYAFTDNVQALQDSGRMLPLIGQVQAGTFCEAVDNFQPGDAEEWIHSGGPVGSRAFVLRVDGISMVPDLQPGELVVIDPDQASNPGDIVLAKRCSDQSVTLKRLRREGQTFYLEAANPSWPDRIIRLDEEWHICGRARRKIVEL